MNFNEKKEPNPVSSLEALFASKLKPFLEELGVNMLLPESREILEKLTIEKKLKRDPRFLKINFDELIKELKKYESLVKPIEKKKEVKIEAEKEFIPINIPESHLKVVEDENPERTKIYIDEKERKEQVTFILNNKKIIDELVIKAKETLKPDSDEIEYVRQGIISESERKEDEEKVRQRRQLFDEKMTLEEKEIKKNSTIFEAVVVDSVNLSQCFGENVKAQPSHEHDDYFRSMDLYLNFKNNDNNDVSLGLDVKVGSIEGQNFAKKIEGILRDIKAGNRKKIKYFKSFNGELKKNVFVPRIAISCELSMVKELMFDFKNLSKEEFSTKLKSHRMSIEIVSQVVGQCRLFAKYAEDCQQKEIADFYHNILSKINEIAEDSTILKRLLVGAGSDLVSRKIKEIIDEEKYKKTAELNNEEEDIESAA
jgi:hypothetical protein